MVLENIKALCKEKGVNIRTLEKEAGIGNGVIRRWDTINPSFENIKRVADYFNVSIDSLLSDKGGAS